MQSYTNNYIVYDDKEKEGILIDVSNDVDKIADFIENLQICLKYIVLTHCHGDHTDGIKELRRLYPTTKILIHEDDMSGLINDEINRCSLIGREPNFIEADIALKDEDVLKFGNLEARVIHTPGHTAGSISILIEDALFSGDTLFKGTTGRIDLPTGDKWKMKNSIEKLLKLPNNTIVYPGHGYSTIIEDEK